MGGHRLCGGGDVAVKKGACPRIAGVVAQRLRRIDGDHAVHRGIEKGHAIGESLCAEEDVTLARTLLHDEMSARATLQLPADLVIAESFSADAQARELDGIEVPAGMMGLDIGRRTAEAYSAEIARAGTVFWNGPMGAFELEPFAAGTRAVADAIVASPAVN